MLGRIWIVARRDFDAVVRTKGFVIGLLFMPLMVLLSTQLPKLLERFGERGDRRVAIVDLTGRLEAPLAAWAEQRNARPGEQLFLRLEGVAPPGLATGPALSLQAARAALEGDLAERVRREELFGWLIIGRQVADLPPPPGDAEATAAHAAESKLAYGAVSLTTGNLRQELRTAVRDAARSQRLAAAGVDAAVMARVDVDVPFDEFVVAKQVKTGDDGVVRSSGMAEAMVPMGLTLLLLMGIMSSAGLLLNATIEEKSNRVVEVLVSSVSAVELMAGKLIGAFLTGLITLLAWGAAGAFAADHFNMLKADTLAVANLAWYAWFFVGGYLLFGAIYLAIGSLCQSIQDAQNMMLPVVLLIMLPMIGHSHLLEHPDSALSRALTFFPWSAPMTMPTRIAQSPPPPTWQVAASAASVAFGVLVSIWAAAKIFRIGIFSSGKPPKLRELWRWLREAS
ncbi:MAG: ABC transporter permease [Planctomycetes bacterium]|nr:ABC transporter permease [Planctomycetota bacterium]